MKVVYSLVVALCVVLIGLAAWFAYSYYTSTDRNKLEVFSIVEDEVLATLRSPGTAVWPDREEKINSVEAYFDGRTYRIQSWVDSQNSFGGMVRTYYTFTLVSVKRPDGSHGWDWVEYYIE